MDPKVLAIYLPQFHETEYNNEWWGKGYTEWTACKAAKPLYQNHYQPRVPLDNNYYDLTNVSTLENQAKLARDYGVDGFAIYHYYSCGNKLLEKPTETLLKRKDIDVGFCLYWANHDWQKAWFGQDKRVIWKQKYGSMQDWKNHFLYCLDFFKDSRYIKFGNKPLFLIFQPWMFKEIHHFMNLWNDMARENGFDGIYFVKTIGARNTERLEGFDAIFRREPFYTFSHGFSKASLVMRVVRTRLAEKVNKVLKPLGRGMVGYTCDYDRMWKNIVKRNDLNSHIIPGAVTDWDNSPRKQYNAQILKHVSPEKFARYFSELYYKASNAGCPYIIVNAWNEWAEGNYLEPDEKYGYGFLEGIKATREGKAIGSTRR